MNKTRRDAGFTLVEIMIAVAIIAILVAIAFPAYRMFYMRAKTSEAVKNMSAIRALQLSHKGVYDTYLTLASHPVVVPSNFQAWGVPADPNWVEIGFVPDGRVRYQYRVEVGNSGDIRTSFKVIAQTDFDGKGPPDDTWTLTEDRTLVHTDRYK